MARRLITPEATVLDEIAYYCGLGRDEGRAELARWVAAGLVAERGGLYDSFEVVNAMRAERGAAWRAEVATQRAKVTSFAAPGEWATPRRLEVTLVREIAAGARAPGSRMRFGIPLPVEEPGQRELTIVPLVGDGDSAEVADGLLDVRAVVPEGAGVVRAGVRIAATVTGIGPTPGPAEFDRDGVIAPLTSGQSARLSPRLAALAGELAGGREGWAAVLRFWEHLLLHVRPGFVHHDELTGDDPLGAALDGGVADCRLSASLLAALCRARGIPARVVGGLSLFARGPGNHWWAEVHCDGAWLPVDSISAVAGGGDLANPWSFALVGRGDYRLATERPPSRLALGIGVRFPDTWHCTVRLAEDGAGVTTYIDAATGDLLYRETVSVR